MLHDCVLTGRRWTVPLQWTSRHRTAIRGLRNLCITMILVSQTSTHGRSDQLERSFRIMIGEQRYTPSVIWMNEWMSLCSPPLIETYREGAVCPSYACLYSSVLSLLQKPVNVRLMSQTVSGNEFQVEGPEVAKLRDPYRANRLRGIVRSWWAAERRCWRPVVDDTGVHMSARYDGAMRRRHLNTIVPSLYWMRCRTGSQWRSWHSSWNAASGDSAVFTIYIQPWTRKLLETCQPYGSSTINMAKANC